MTQKFLITNNGVQREVKPLNVGDLQARYQKIKGEGQYGYTHEMSNDIVLGMEDYAYIKNIEANEFCNKMIFTWQLSCDGIVFNDYLTAFFYITDCSFLTRCRVSIKMSSEKICPKADIEQNVFDYVSIRKSVRINSPSISYETVTYQKTINYNYSGDYAWGNTSSTPQQGFFSVKKHTFVWDGTAQTGIATTVWIREVLTTDCISTVDTTWTLVTDNCPTNKIYARHASLFDLIINETSGSNDGSYSRTFEYKVLTDVTNALGIMEIPNGVSLKDVLTFFANQICGITSVKSDFYQINPTNVSSINYVTNKQTTVNNIFIFDNSDVKRPTSAEKATRLTMSFDDLMKVLNGLHNVEYWINNGVLEIEHVSFFSSTIGIDTTLPIYDKFMSDKDGYTYANSSVPKTETFRFEFGRNNSDFRPAEISYNSCVTTTEDELKEIKCTTDLIMCLTNPSNDSNIVSDEGFFVAAAQLDTTSGAYYFLTEPNVILTVGVEPNNVLGTIQLLRNYHRWNRPFIKGTINGIEMPFFGTRLKSGDEFSLNLQCNQINNFDPYELMKTKIGDGVIDEATYTPLSCKMNFKLKY